MNINDETYSDVNIDLDREDDMAYSTMDSDFVPNNQQYGIAFCASKNCL